MVSGINISSPPSSGAGNTKNTVGKPAASPVKTQKNMSQGNTRQIESRTSSNVLSTVAKAVDKRVSVLTSGNTVQFLQAAEKIIDASLPSKPPGTRLRINLDRATGRFIYQGVDLKTGKVVTQFPASEVLKQLAFVREREGADGIVVDKKV